MRCAADSEPMSGPLTLPTFRYHPDPLGSGSVVASGATCRCCGQARGHVYTGPAYAEADLDDALCAWCIADGSAHAQFDVTFVDSEAFGNAVPEAVVQEICRRTPGFNTFQSEQWPDCCQDATAFLEPAGIDDIRARYRELEGAILNHIIYDLEVSGGAATRLLASLRRDQSPSAYVFRCRHCEQLHFRMDEA
jgi:uncharacterized protein CbrC (UPF0167 family)